MRYRPSTPEGSSSVSEFRLSDGQMRSLYSGEAINLAEASLVRPHSGLTSIGDLIGLLLSVNRKIQDPYVRLDNTFMRDAMLLAANIGSVRDQPNLPIITDSEHIDLLKNDYNLEFKPGALIPESIAIDAVSYLNSTGIGNFIAVEQSTSAYCRIYHHNLRRVE